MPALPNYKFKVILKHFVSRHSDFAELVLKYLILKHTYSSIYSQFTDPLINYKANLFHYSIYRKHLCSHIKNKPTIS